MSSVLKPRTRWSITPELMNALSASHRHLVIVVVALDAELQRHTRGFPFRRFTWPTAHVCPCVWGHTTGMAIDLQPLGISTSERVGLLAACARRVAGELQIPSRVETAGKVVHLELDALAYLGASSHDPRDAAQRTAKWV